MRGGSGAESCGAEDARDDGMVVSASNCGTRGGSTGSGAGGGSHVGGGGTDSAFVAGRPSRNSRTVWGR